jgi:hypothetical protein
VAAESFGTVKDKKAARFSSREIRFWGVAPVFVRSTQPGCVRDAAAVDLDRLGIKYYSMLQDGHTECVD